MQRNYIYIYIYTHIYIYPNILLSKLRRRVDEDEVIFEDPISAEISFL